MTAVAPIYPPGPAGVPADLTAPSWRYRWQVLVVLTTLFLFLFLYLGMIAGTAYLFSYAWQYPVEKGASPGYWVWKVLGLLGAALILFLLVRGLFRHSKTDRALLVEVREADQPLLFAFLRQLCGELKAPLPHQVFLSPEVNAAMFADTSLLSLFRPARRNLLIGLGLVNALNLTEFKAVLAHEFGHFSQKSTRLTRYVYTANPIMADLVYGRDWLDAQVARGTELLISVAAVDVRILAGVLLLAFPLIIPLVFFSAFRLLLGGLFKAINFQNLSLMRQMEFNADLVAASVTGSDALVHVLARLQFATETLVCACEELAGAADHGVYTRDLFYHQGRTVQYLRKLCNDPSRGEPPPLPDDPAATTQVFRIDDKAVLAMWSTHPPHFERERNLKRRYLRSTWDERSPWALFEQAEAVRARVTEQFYRRVLEAPGDAVWMEPPSVQAVLEAERAEMTYDPCYRGVYDDRYLEPLDLDALTALAAREPWDAERLTRCRQTLYDDALAHWAVQHRQRLREFHHLGSVAAEEGFEFRGQAYPPGEARRVRNQVRRELDEDRWRWTELDRTVFLVHYQMGLALDPPAARELVERYRFHLAIQGFLTELTGQHDWVASVLQFLSECVELTHDQYSEIVRGSLHAQEVVSRCLATANGLTLPRLQHIPEGRPLGDFLRRQRASQDARLDEKALGPKRLVPSLGQFLQQLGELRDRCRRVHFKSLGGILKLQEELHGRWAAPSPPGGEG